MSVIQSTRPAEGPSERSSNLSVPLALLILISSVLTKDESNSHGAVALWVRRIIFGRGLSLP